MVRYQTYKTEYFETNINLALCDSIMLIIIGLKYEFANRKMIMAAIVLVMGFVELIFIA
jgi:hypothetical protein